MDCTEQNMAHAPFSQISGFVFSVAHPLANCKHLFVSGGIFVGFCRKPREWPPVGGISRPIAVPHPRTATPFTPNFISPSAARSLVQRHKLYGSPPRPYFSMKKSRQKTYLGQIGSRLSASRSHRRVTACTARRRGVPFTCVKGTKTHLGLRPKTP